MSMKSLWIETTQNQSVLALFSESGVEKVSTLSLGPCGKDDLFVSLSEFLSDQERKEFAFFSCCRGPGSYTGTRLGVTVAATLAYAQKKPLVSVTRLSGFRKHGNETVIYPGKEGKFLQLGADDEVFVVDALPKGQEIVCPDEALCVRLGVKRVERSLPEMLESFQKSCYSRFAAGDLVEGLFPPLLYLS